MPLSAGTKLGPYEIVGLLGEGGMGEVYRARDPRIDREVAVKVLPAALAEHPDRLRRFEQEARAAGSLNHPNLLTIFELGTREDAPYIVSELLEGKTLREMLRDLPAQRGSNAERKTPLPTRKVVDYGSQIASGLAAAHEKGIVHRDLKPENVFVTSHGRVKILDFGLAKLTTAADEGITNAPTAEHHTDPGTVLGTIGYMSPEQVRGQNVDARSDIFALGAILFEMAAGARAFRGDTSADTMSAILTRDPLEEAESASELSPGLRRIVDHCLEKSPEQRFQSAHDLAFDLSTLSSISESGVAPAVSETSVRSSRVPLLLLVALLAGIALGWAATFFGRPEVIQEPPRFVRLTHSGRDISPAASPDGRTIAFSSLRDRSAPEDRLTQQGAGRIWVKQLNGGGEVAITSGPLDSNPRFSPDGSTLLFLRTEEQRVNLLRVPILGGDARTIRPDVLSADWSPDGQRIVFSTFGEEDGVNVTTVSTISSNGSDEKELARVTDRVIRGVRWSPDGSRIAGVERPTSGTTSSRIIFIDAEDGSIEPFEDPMAHGYQMFLAWVPDGNLVWSNLGSSFSQTTSLHLHEFDRGETRTLFWSLAGVGGIDVLLPDQILFSSGDQRQNLRISTRGATGVSSNGEWLTRGSGVDRQPVYSPDGEWVIFSSTRSGNLDLWQLATSSGEVSRLTDDVANDWDPAYTPDGESIIWSSDRSGVFEIWMARRDGSGAHQVTRDGVDAENPTMTVDGEWIAYSSAGSENRGIWKIRPDGSEATKLAAGTYILPEVSPDGRWVSYLEQSPESASHATVHVVSIDGRVAPFRIEIDSPVPATNLGRHRWLPDGSGIAFWSADEDGNFGFFAQDFEPDGDTSSTRRKFAGFDNEVQAESFGIAPDGSEVTISVTDYEFAIVMADGVGLNR